MNTTVTVMDYGVGNLMSVGRAFEYCGANVILTDDPRKIKQADRLVLPGVGAFADGMSGLHDRGLIESVREYASSGRPFLGICLGMQMMMDQSEEFGLHHGLGLIPGVVTPIPDTTVEGNPHKIPHIGWNELRMPTNGREWNGTILDGIPELSTVYFVHSFSVTAHSDANLLSFSDYHGRKVTAVIQQGAMYGCQFHPEKSGKAGLQMINNWLYKINC